MNALAHPSPDLLATLPDAARAELKRWSAALAEIKPPLAEAFRRLAGEMGVSWVTVKRRYQAARRGDWQALMDRRSCPELWKNRGDQLPEEFIEWVKGLCERNQRTSRAALREAIRLWKLGEPIPGYPARPPAELRTGVPRGWTERNLYRHLPTKFELRAARIGRSAARELAPLVFTTRVGLEVGQFYVFDDLEHDVKVNFLGRNMSAMRPLELAALDLYSGCKFAWGMKPVVENELTQKKEKLKLSEMRFLLAHVLTNIGYRAAGTTLLVEHGTAAIPADLEAFLADCTGGALRVQRGGIEGAAAFAGAYAGRGKGNFRFKAALESHHALTHTELAALPGQMGANSRLNAPEELHGRDRENDALLAAMLALPDQDRAALLRMPFLEFNHFQRLTSRIYEAINRRTWHGLEGWEEAGLVAYELTPHGQKIRKMSPREVFDPAQGTLAKLPPHLVPMILGEANSAERRVGENGLFEFEDRELGAGEYRYLAQARGVDGRVVQLREGESYRTVVNPLDPRFLFVTDAKGRYVGACPRWSKVSRADTDALQRQMGAAARQLSERLAPLAARGREITRQRIADTLHNARVLGTGPVTETDRAKARNVKRQFRGASAELLEGGEVAVPSSKADTKGFDASELLNPEESRG